MIGKKLRKKVVGNKRPKAAWVANRCRCMKSGKTEAQKKRKGTKKKMGGSAPRPSRIMDCKEKGEPKMKPWERKPIIQKSRDGKKKKGGGLRNPSLTRGLVTKRKQFERRWSEFVGTKTMRRPLVARTVRSLKKIDVPRGTAGVF